jgi:hypothetical protein
MRENKSIAWIRGINGKDVFFQVRHFSINEDIVVYGEANKSVKTKTPPICFISFVSFDQPTNQIIAESFNKKDNITEIYLYIYSQPFSQENLQENDEPYEKYLFSKIEPIQVNINLFDIISGETEVNFSFSSGKTESFNLYEDQKLKASTADIPIVV